MLASMLDTCLTIPSIWLIQSFMVFSSFHLVKSFHVAVWTIMIQWSRWYISIFDGLVLAKTTRSEQEEDELSERVEMHCARMKECLDKGGGNLCSSGSLIRRGRGNRSKPKLTFEHWFVTTFHKHNYFIRCGRSSCRNDRQLLTTPAF